MSASSFVKQVLTKRSKSVVYRNNFEDLKIQAKAFEPPFKFEPI